MKPVAWWIDLWDRREPATAQVLVRILVGLCLFVDLAQIGWLGLVDAIWARPPDGMGYGRSEHLWATDPQLLWTAAVVSAGLFTVGAATRAAGVVFVIASAQLGYLSPDSDRGIDMMLRVVVGILVFSSCHARWSVDAWVRRRIGRPFPEEVPAWPRYLLFVQLLWIYFSGGHNKTGIEWGVQGNFEALANVLADPGYRRFDPDWVPALFPLTQVATAATMAFELGAPLMLVFTTLDRYRPLRWLRWTWIALGAGFHLGIATFMCIGIFPWGMLAMYPVLFHADEIARAEAWVRRRRSL